MDLTRDQIIFMPAGADMDALVAQRVMGYTLTTVGALNGTRSKKAVWDTGLPLCELAVGHFAPSERIGWAWMVVERLSKQNFYSHHTDLSIDSGQAWWVWHFVQHASNTDFTAYGDTASLAICRAALLAVLGL